MLPRLPLPGDLIQCTKQWYWREERLSAPPADSDFVWVPYIPLQITTTTIPPPSQKLKVKWASPISYGSSNYVNPSPAYYAPISLQLDQPTIEDALLVCSFEATTLRVMLGNRCFRVTAECTEHIINDFELLSGID